MSPEQDSTAMVANEASNGSKDNAIRGLANPTLNLRVLQPLELGGACHEITVLFTDIEGFAQLTETEQHERMIDDLADYSDIIPAPAWAPTTSPPSASAPSMIGAASAASSSRLV